MNVGIYVRVSTEEQRDYGYSIDAQLREIKEYCERRNLNIIDIYNDAGHSAKNLNRPEMERMLNDIKNGKINLVISMKVDRLTREGYDPTLRERLGLPEGLYEKPFRTREQAERALAALTPSIDFAKLSAHREELRSYFGGLIHPGEHLFDIGYSGRAEAALTSLLGFPVNSLYLHAGGQILFDRSARYGFSNACFFDYKPAITGVIREHVLMKLSPSVVGYERIGGVLQPKWETYSPDPRTVLVTEILQAGALDFVRDMCRTFGMLYRFSQMFQYHLSYYRIVSHTQLHLHRHYHYSE